MALLNQKIGEVWAGNHTNACGVLNGLESAWDFIFL
jgi:mannose-6-phosphate isomerase class I